MTRRSAFGTLARTSLVALAASACRPDFEERDSLVTRPRVIAVRAEPAEAKPDERVTVTVLVASPSGTIAAPATSFAFCATPKLLTENGAVSAACTSSGVRTIGDAPGTIAAPIPHDACALFGPDPPSPKYRPRDPDVTGGYYQPVRATPHVAASDEPLVAFGFARIACSLANAGADVVAAFQKSYRVNENPALLPLEARIEGVPTALDAIAHGARVALRAAWNPASAESYVVLDAASQTLETRRESLRVSWYATGGTFDQDRTGRGDDEPESFADNVWTAPDAPGVVHLWTVLRDARGGIAFADYDVVVRK